ncbi:MAG TPA: DUF3090 family protein [Candidatus Dormibacteraeota bacterium]|jgi:uncharacterized repeat protein (TIGR03847 family)|nr:DUF3090 family protein [Candidatus Dormibacteraeota bacterium]
MSSREFEFGSVGAVTVATKGTPGARQFFIQARSGEDLFTVACEKFHIQSLMLRIRQLLDAHDLGQPPLHAPISPRLPLEARWSAAEVGVGYHEAKQQFVIVIRETGDDEARSTVRFWVGVDPIRAFVRQAEQTLAAGRPICVRCGFAMDPAGHPCPASNGARPIF